MPMSPELTELLERAHNHTMTPREKFEQKVSFVFSGVPDGMTKDEVRRDLCEHGGYPEEWAIPPQERDK